MQYKQRMEVNEGQIFLEEGWENPAEPLLTRMAMTVINTRDSLIREGLKKLGWLSPEETLDLRLKLSDRDAEVAELAETAEFYRKELYEKKGEAVGEIRALTAERDRAQQAAQQLAEQLTDPLNAARQQRIQNGTCRHCACIRRCDAATPPSASSTHGRERAALREIIAVLGPEPPSGLSSGAAWEWAKALQVAKAAYAAPSASSAAGVLDKPARVAGRDFLPGEPVQRVIGRAHAHYNRHHSEPTASPPAEAGAVEAAVHQARALRGDYD